MLDEPRIVERPEQPYVAIRCRVAMSDLGPAIDGSFPKVFDRLADEGIPPAGPPFVRFDVIDMERQLEIEVGVPVSSPPPDDGEIVADKLPAGRYGVITFTGPYEGLVGANEALQEWGRTNGQRWAMTESADGDRFESRFESYLTDPAEEPDPQRWVTEVAYLIADS
jgi:effector-binding domain-containing protein